MTKSAAAPPLTRAERWPLVLTLPEVARIYGLEARTLRAALARGHFRPLPVMRDPYRWRKIDVVRDLERRASPSRPS